MIKRLIFDLDNTLIEWKDEYWKKLEKVLNKLNIKYDNQLVNNIIKSVDTYEQVNEYYTKQKMLEHINKTTNYNFNMDFMNKILEEFGKCIPNDNKDICNILEYLSSKYELVILTNWFKDVQVNRLRNFEILSYFSNVFASENFKIKPNKESFIIAMENRNPHECIMIGDSLKNDIEGAINVGIKAIYLNANAQKEISKNYIIINKLEELKEIL